MLEKIQKIEKDVISFTVFRPAVERGSVIKLHGPSLVLFDSAKNFEDIAVTIVWQTRESQRLRHLVYFPNATHEFINETIKDGFIIDYVGFLMDESEKSIKLVAAFMFTEAKCRVLQLVNINHFDGRVMKWESDNFYPQKYQNFYGCLMTQFRSSWIVQIFDVALTEISSILNFDLQFQIHERKLKISLHEFRLLRLFDFYQEQPDVGEEDFIFTMVFYSAEVYFLLPPGEPLTSLEKLLSPFDETIWILIATI